MSNLSIGSLLVEAYEVIYVFFSLYKYLVCIFYDFDETSKNYIL